MRFLIIAAAFMAALSFVSSDEVACEFEEIWWSRLDLTFNSCTINEGSFSEPGSTISSDQDLTLKGFGIVENQQTLFIPVNFYEKFPNIYVIQFDKCSIRHVGEDAFKGLKDLQVLYLSNNNIRTIDDNAFKDNVKLNLIDLDDNDIKFVKPVWFEHLSVLRTIYLENNNIRYVDPNTFTSLVSIENINLNENEISYLDPKTFENLSNLKNFTVANNDLTLLDKDLFKTNAKLHRVVFDYNALQVIDPEMFDNNAELFMVDLTGNSCVNAFFGNAYFDDMKAKLKELCSAANLNELEKAKFEELKALANTCKFY